VPGSGNKKRARAQAARQRAQQSRASAARRQARAAAAAPRPGGPALAERLAVPPAFEAAASRPAVTSAAAAGAAVPAQVAGESADWTERILREVLTVTCWLDPGDAGGPYPVTVRFSGRRTDVDGKPGPGDNFTHEETFDGIAPGSGPVAVTATIHGISKGTWTAEARPVSRPGEQAARLYAPPGGAAARRGELRPRRVPVPAGPRSEASTALLPFIKIPGVLRFAWAALVGLGVLAGLAIQAVLLGRAHLPAGHGLIVSLYVVAGGLAGAKVYYIAVNGGRRFDGWCVQGSVLGGAVTAGAVDALGGLGMPAGAYLASAALGLLAGMAIGRPGCFWAGCCVGRPTAARWGIWSSDRRIGSRRVPAQLLEALLALAAALAMLITVLLLGLPRSGWAAVAALAGYTSGRQFILRARAETPRRTPLSGPVTAAIAAAVLVAAIIMLVLTAA